MDMQLEDFLIQIRAKLNDEQIKLWLEPYFKDGKSNTEELEKLARRYSDYLFLPYEACLMTVEELQKNALENLRQKQHFRETGWATLKVRLPQETSDGQKTLNVEVKLSYTGLELKNKISPLSNIPANRMKLIAGGKVLDDNQVLDLQGIKHGAHLMVLELFENPSAVETERSQMEEIEAIKADTQLLASNSSAHYMNLEDQHGNRIKLPLEEQKALMVAMALHEKGRAAMKNENYSFALIMFLDADKEFRRCNSTILDTVDNYAVLNLDIVWCYLCLRSVSQIPEAEKRLKQCEISFRKSYGENLERLLVLKGTTGNEAALLMRLHLLQAIVHYHQNHRNDALRLLLKAEEELEKLKVDENSLMALIELGFSAAEARLGLRATMGDVNAAAEHINNLREQRAKSRKKGLEEMLLENKRKKLGKCADGKQYVDPELVNTLHSMGYSRETARLALQRSNNDISASIQIIQDNEDLRNIASTMSASESFTQFVMDITPQLQAAGFNPEAVRRALQLSEGDVLSAVDQLYSTFGDDIPEASTSAGLGMSAEARRERREMEKQALDRLQEVIPAVEDDHLDLTLEKEEIFLKEYKSLLLPD